MARPKTKQMTVDAIKHVAEKGVIETWACNDPNRPGHVKGMEREDALTIEMHYCTAFLSRNESLQMAVSIVHAGTKQWGPDFLSQVETLLEGLRGQ